MTRPNTPASSASSLPSAHKTVWVKCPKCQSKTLYSAENRWRPFCSAHCYNLDLGAWASEGYRIQNNSAPEDDPEG